MSTYTVSTKGIRQTDAEEALSDARYYADELVRAINRLNIAVTVHEDDVPSDRYAVRALRIARDELVELLGNLDPEGER